MSKIFLAFLLLLMTSTPSWGWGFFAHKKINRLAVFTLPPEMMLFYKHYLVYITENAAKPDARRYVVPGEACRHYIDIDHYDAFFGAKGLAVLQMPRYWEEAAALFCEDTLKAYGIVPWQVNRMKYQLSKAFEEKDVPKILKISTEIGHYIADAHVPLHTTLNYNGQYSNQQGIHAFWESRLPELFFEGYDFFVGEAQYLQKPQIAIWDAIVQAHQALDSVLELERKLSIQFPKSKKYTMEEKNNLLVKNYSLPYSKAYHQLLNGQVERQMRASVKMLGDMWYTAWVDAGQPDLSLLLDKDYLKLLEEENEQQLPFLQERNHEQDSGFCFSLIPWQSYCCRLLVKK